LISTGRSLLYVRNRNQDESCRPEPYEYSEAAEKTWIPTPANNVREWITFQISSCNALAEFSGEALWPEYKKPSVPCEQEYERYGRDSLKWSHLTECFQNKPLVNPLRAADAVLTWHRPYWQNPAYWPRLIQQLAPETPIVCGATSHAYSAATGRRLKAR
jgi:hypothetical protein